LYKNFIFGYGSLINKKSRENTAQNKLNNIYTPVKVKKIKREWNIKSKKYNMITLGIDFKNNNSCNGVIFNVSKNELKNFDKREKPYGYKRIELKKELIQPYKKDNLINKGKIWFYINNKNLLDKEIPLVQSYIDVVLCGCLNIGEKFAQKFITTTNGWDKTWINDRKEPRYLRSMNISKKKSKKIDELLKKVIPKYFHSRKLLDKYKSY